MDRNSWLISRRAAMLALGTAATLPWLHEAAFPAGKDKTTDKAADKTADKTKDKDKDKPADKTKDKDKVADKTTDKSKDKDKTKDKDKEKPHETSGGKYGGFGGHVTGGEGHASVKVKTAKDLEAAVKKGNCSILIEAQEIEISKCISSSASNITIDGQGCTLRGDQMAARGGSHMLNFDGAKNIVLKNLRLRNGPDNLDMKGSKDIVVYHVSSTGSGDDGISIGYGCENVTISHCFVAGCARPVFCKYKKNSRYTIAHNWIMKLWERAPLLYVKDFDVRNNMVQEWVLWATRPYADSCGNIMGNLYICPPDSKNSKKTSAVEYSKGMDPLTGKVFVKDNVFRNCSGAAKSTTDSALSAPAIVPAYTTDLNSLEKSLKSDTHGAGCMPRDAIDKAYIAAKEYHVSHDGGYRIDENGKVLPSK